MAILKHQKLITLLLVASVTLSGCFVTHPPCLVDNDLDSYRTLAAPRMPSPEEGYGRLPLSTAAPLAVDPAAPPPSWNLTLDQVIKLSLENSKVFRDLGGSVLRTPSAAQTINDPAIQASDPRFGMEGALSAFDAQINSRFVAQHNDRAFNNLFFGGGASVFQQDLDTFDTELVKPTALGGSFAVRHHIDYDANTAPANIFPSAWNTNYEAEARQPLLQGAGVEFNRIAGPKATPGLVNGVVIARINNDVSTSEFEIGLRDFVSNIENAYWDLYYAYRELDAKIAARDASLDTWRRIHTNVETGRYSKLQEAQALEQYYRFQEDVLDSLGGRLVDRTRTNNGTLGGTFRGVGGVQAAERKLRLLMGVPINDGRLIRPTDEPPQAKVSFDWRQVVQESLTRRPELRRQHAQVQRSEMELVATRNFLLPRLDFVGKYRWRGFGHDWMGPSVAATNDPFNNALANLASGQFQEWEMGVEYSMPLGFRKEHAAVRNAQFRVAREKAILEEQERQAVHDLAASFADVDRANSIMRIAFDRFHAAQNQFELAHDAFFERGGKVSLELVLDAQIRLTESEANYYRARSDYAITLKNVHFEKGSLLEYNGAVLACSVSDGDQCACASKGLVIDQSANLLNYILARDPLKRSREVAEETPARRYAANPFVSMPANPSSTQQPTPAAPLATQPATTQGMAAQSPPTQSIAPQPLATEAPARAPEPIAAEPIQPKATPREPANATPVDSVPPGPWIDASPASYTPPGGGWMKSSDDSKP